jgi:hypothetical protein
MLVFRISLLCVGILQKVRGQSAFNYGPTARSTGADSWNAIDGGFSHAVDLVRFIREKFGDYFCVAVAGFPETHAEAESPEVLSHCSWLMRTFSTAHATVCCAFCLCWLVSV